MQGIVNFRGVHGGWELSSVEFHGWQTTDGRLRVSSAGLGTAYPHWEMLTSSVPNLLRFSSTHRSSYHYSLLSISSFRQLLLKMLSMRTLARTVPRTFSRSIASSSRFALRPVANLPKTSFIQPSLKQGIRPSQAAFSTCRVFRQAEGKHKLQSRGN